MIPCEPQRRSSSSTTSSVFRSPNLHSAELIPARPVLPRAFLFSVRTIFGRSLPVRSLAVRLLLWLLLWLENLDSWHAQPPLSRLALLFLPQFGA